MHINLSKEMNVVFNILHDTKETASELMYKEFSTKCLCQIKRDVLNERDESIYIEKMAIRNVNWQYDKYTIKNFERIGFENVIKIIWYSLVKSEEINNFDIEKISFHFSKQDYFSHKMFKKISQEYFKVIKFEMNTINSFFSKKEINDISNKGKGLYTREGKHVLTINNSEFDLFFSEKVDVHPKSKSLFLIFLNTLDIRYLHFCDLYINDSKAFCIILENLKKRIDEIVFFKAFIYDETIISLNANLNFVDLEKNIFIYCNIDENMVVFDFLSKINELVFYEDNILSKKYLRHEIKDKENHNIVENIIEILERTYKKSTPEESVRQNKKITEEYENFYLRLLNEKKCKNKVKIFESFDNAASIWRIQSLYEYNGYFNNISITLSKLNSEQIEITSSKITSKFRTEILNVNGLARLEINYSDILFESDICVKNKSIKYFKFWKNKGEIFGYFFELLNMMVDLKEVFFMSEETLKLSRSVSQIFYITELNLLNVNRMIDFLKILANNKNFDLTAAYNDILDLECPSDSVKFLFKNYDLSSINELSLYDFSIDKSNLKAFSNLLNLKELNFFRINFENISLSELFCASQEYKIKIMKLKEINISEKDLIFIANLKNLKKLEFERCYIQQKTYIHCI
ncbi:hypothetical protein CWI36_1227p0010 [Hamiltosporidium magnivora]|uniref:Uncharacterized protein n=1 Tax=Hamiltosporidium magnivora TaxID=148818 RepID=A0A4Q9L399_9MICR|nr:hypothetical protein CWI36_1227p0010 [Hamiltosporidium magnivora]